MTPTPGTHDLLTERLHLTPYTDEHLSGLNAVNADPEVMRYLSGRPETLAETQAMIGRVKTRWATFGYSWWTIIEQQSGDIIGAGCIQHLRRGGTDPDPGCPLEIGWRLRRDQWSKGFASEAARAMAAFAFDRLRTDVLYAVCDPENRASEAVMMRLGMRRLGLESWYDRQVTTYALTAQAWHDLSRGGRPG